MLSLAATLLLAAADLTPADVTPPPMVEVELSRPGRQRSAGLLVDEAGVQRPSSAGALLGRVLLAPAAGLVGGVVGLSGSTLMGAAFAYATYDVTPAIVGMVVGGVLASVLVAAGTAVGASLFAGDSRGFAALMLRSLPWAVGASAIITAVATISLTLAPLFALPLIIGTACVTAAAVPLLVEARRLAEPARSEPQAGVPLATF